MAEVASQSPAATAKPKSGVFVPHRPTRLQRVVAWIIATGIRGVAATLRYRLEDGSGFFDPPPRTPAIYAVWHNRLALCLIGYYRYGYGRNPTQGMAAMCSASRDGALLAAILDEFRVQPVRGSTSRRGRQALLELIGWAEKGYDLAITPDGPRGPRCVVQDGVMALAQVTGLPILPFSYRLEWKITLKSWDAFQVPLPFSRCLMKAAPPIRVPREATDAQREALRQQLQAALIDLSGD